MEQQYERHACFVFTDASFVFCEVEMYPIDSIKQRDTFIFQSWHRIFIVRYTCNDVAVEKENSFDINGTSYNYAN